MKFFYFSGSCHDSETAKEEIRKNFLSVISKVLNSDVACTQNQRTCVATKVEIKCGQEQSRDGKVKRSAQVYLLIFLLLLLLLFFF